MGRIRVGIAGWDYRDWIGPVYPKRSPAGFDRLAFVSRFVDVIEVNSTFYRPVAARVAESWIRRTELRGDALVFCAKSHRSWTHAAAPPDPSEVRETLDGLAPLRESKRLAALLIQFPYSFRYGGPARERLATLADRAEGWPLVVEVRHSSWQSAAAERWFAGTGLGWCVVDQPQVGRFPADDRPRVTSRLGYLRLHGRNSRNWFREDAGRDERYDYLYSRAELEELATRATEMATVAEELVVVQNNHFRGQALANALQLRQLLGDAKPAAPQGLVDAFPFLADSVAVERTRLF